MKFLRRWFGRKRLSGFDRYIALGDSISIDDYPGEGKGAASLLHRNQDHLYPDFSGKDLYSMNPETSFSNLARDGASSYDVLHDQLPQLKADSGKTLITLTCGGNDILSHHADADEVLHRINTIVERIRALYPSNEIIIGTIYDPSDGDGDLFDTHILEKELKTAHEINDGIRRLRSQQIRIAEIHKHFLGHGLHCKDPSHRYFHPEDPSLWYVLTIEPNSRGAHEIRRLFWLALNAQERQL